MNTRHIVSTITAVIVFSIPAFVFAGDSTIEGTLQGADCTYLGTQCPREMTPGRIALESDFVLTTKTGEIYYIPNISKTVKGAYLRVPVRIKGNRDQDVLKAESLEIKKDGKFTQVWKNDDERYGYGSFFKR